MDTQTNVAYKLLSDNLPALWSNEGIAGQGTDGGLTDLYEDTKLTGRKCLVFASLASRFKAPMYNY